MFACALFSSWVQNLTSLKELTIAYCSQLQTLFSCLHHLTSLQQLNIEGSRELNMSNGIDEIQWKELASLSHLTLNGLEQLVSLPQGLQQVTTLQEIEIYGCENLEAALDCITNLKSLKTLSINYCPKLNSLPEGIDSLTSLQKLEIRECPMLLERCQRYGDYWTIISGIKEVILEQERDIVTSNLLPLACSEPASNQEQNEDSILSKICRHFAEINRKFWLLISTLCLPPEPNAAEVEVN